jgi:PadR family transcriptional regulator, regulatory protein PadR
MVTPRFEKMRMELRRGSLVMAALMALQSEAYGYALRKRLIDVGLDIDEGTLYPLIRRLEEQGLLESRWDASDEGRKRRYYVISTDGLALLQELQAEWKSIHQSLEKLTQQELS